MRVERGAAPGHTESTTGDTTLRQALDTFSSVGFVNLYGQTEGMVSGLPRELHGRGDAAEQLSSVGFPMRDIGVRIVDDLPTLPTGKVDEVAGRSLVPTVDECTGG